MIVFIKTHGRPNKQLTYETLRKSGYTGDIVLVLDDEDDTYNDYLKYFDEHTSLETFYKEYYVQNIDSGKSNPKRNVNLYAWCACEDLAKAYGEKFFIMADDDITGFRYRYEEDGHLKSLKITQNLDLVFNYISDYMLNSDISSISTGIPQMYFNKDMNANLHKWRVPYTFVFRNARHKVDWVSEYEEDIITAINSANKGQYMMVFPMIQRDTVEIGSNQGGMHEFYKQSLTNAQYGHMYHPSCEEIISYKGKYMCKIKRDNAFPKLISSSVKKLNGNV